MEKVERRVRGERRGGSGWRLGLIQALNLFCRMEKLELGFDARRNNEVD